VNPPIQLVPHQSSHELVEVLTGLLDAAKSGALNGIVFGCSFRGQKFYCDAAGALHRNPVVAIGVSTMLTAELEHQIRRKAQDSIF
jgi:hypothetical protein